MDFDYGLWFVEEATDFVVHSDFGDGGVGPHREKHFEKYDSKPWDWARIDDCKTIREKNIVEDLTDWILNSEKGVTGLLMALEPLPSSRCMMSKCIFMHEAKDTASSTRKERTELFILQRLELVQQLVSVYKKARSDIKKEHNENLSSQDPDCECKRATATKKIVDMMIKQFALEYLYLKTFKIDKEIEASRCHSFMRDRLEHLKNIRKYTSRTAEKLRYLLNRECLDESGDTEKYFEEEVLKDMARMYLDEIRRLTASHLREGSEGWIPDQLFQETLETTVVSSETDISDASSMMDQLMEIKDAFDEELPDELKPGPAKCKNKLEEEKAKEAKSKKVNFVCDQLISDEAPQEVNVERMKIVEELKKELWLINAFRYYTTQINPLVQDKVEIFHEINMYDMADSESLVTSFFDDSSVNSILQPCLVYLSGKGKGEEKKEEPPVEEQPVAEVTKFVSVPSDYTIQIGDAISSCNLISDYVTDDEGIINPVFDTEPFLDYTDEGELMEEYDSKTALDDAMTRGKLKREMESYSRASSIPSHTGALSDVFALSRPCADRRAEGLESSDVSLSIKHVEIDDHTAKSLDDNNHELESKSEVSNRVLTELDHVMSSLKIRIQDLESPVCPPPSLHSVLRHFINTLLDKSDPECPCSEEKVEVEELCDMDDCFHLPYLEKLFSCQRQDAHVVSDEPSHDFQQRCSESNTEYMLKHPEMFAIISLILRECMMRRPTSQLIAFIKDLLFQENFAERLSSYLEINNKVFRRRMNQWKNTMSTKTTFRLDKSSLDHWRDWGVQYNVMREKHCREDRPPVEEKDAEEATDPWNLDVYMKDEEALESPRDPEKDARREKSQVAKLAETLDWGLPPDTRSSCQKLFLPRFVFDRQKNKYVKIPPPERD